MIATIFSSLIQFFSIKGYIYLQIVKKCWFQEHASTTKHFIFGRHYNFKYVFLSNNYLMRN